MKRKFCVLNLTFCIFMCLLSMGLAGCGNDEPVAVRDADEIVSEGWKEYVAGNFEDAIVRFQEAVEKYPDSSEAFNGIGWSKARLGQIDEAIDEFGRAVTKDPANVDARAGLAGVYFVDMDYEQAIASANLVLSLQPEYESHHDDIGVDDVRILLAECYYNTGDYADAKAQMEIVGGSGGVPPSSNLVGLLSLLEELAEK